MKREARLLLERAVDSLVLGIEIFNRPSDRGRTEAVLIHLDHSFEMLLKAAILQKGGRIHAQDDRHTIGFDHCVRVALTDGKAHFLVEEDAVVLRSLNSLRDAAQHYLISVSEQQLYIHSQGSLTLFRKIMRDVLKQELSIELPDRVLPVSTTPPVDLTTMFDIEVEEVKKLLGPGKRQRIEAMARLRSIAIVHGAIEGKTSQPSISELHRLGKSVLKGNPLGDLFPGITTVNLTTTGVGPSLELRITKNEGVAVHLITADAVPGGPVIAVKRVDELGFYNLGRNDVSKKVGLSGNKTSAMIWHLKLKDDAEFYKDVVLGKSHFPRYSQKAISRIAEALKTVNIETVWAAYNKRNKTKTCAPSVAQAGKKLATAVPA